MRKHLLEIAFGLLCLLVVYLLYAVYVKHTTVPEKGFVEPAPVRFVTIRILEIPNQADAALLMDTETHKFYTSHLRRFSAFTPSKSDLALAKQYRKDTNGKLN